MNKGNMHSRVFVILGWAAICLLAMMPNPVVAQNFDFQKLENTVREYTVILDMKVEVSFGMQTAEQEQQLIGTIVTEDGIVMFDGTGLYADNGVGMGGIHYKVTPVKITVTTLDGKEFEGEYIGVDRVTRIGFLKVTNAGDHKFKAVRFERNYKFRVGNWVGLYMLLPEFAEPRLGADVGMLSAMITAPEEFPLTIGFSEIQMNSVLYSEDLKPLGVLGLLRNPSDGMDNGMMDSPGRFELPMLGVITAEKLEKLIAEPPKKGEEKRAWLGITLQALTEDIGDFLGLEAEGGIIVNNIVKGSPAEAAGLEIGDVITAINGAPVEVDREEKLPIFQRAISEMEPGTAVEFSVLRPTEDGAESLQKLATLENAPMAAADAPEYENEALEFKVRDLVFGDYLYYNLDEETLYGVVVTELQRGGLSSVGGLRLGDIIQRVGTDTIRSVDQLKAASESVEQQKPEEVIFFVWRDNKTLFVNVKTDW